MRNFLLFLFLLSPLLAAGQTECSTATVAVEGTNTIPATASSEYWFTYTMQNDERLVISSATTVSLELYTNDCDFLNYKGWGNGGGTFTDFSAGDQVFIEWSTYGGGDFDWELSVEPLVTGDNCSLADVASEGTNALPATTADNYWYSYTMPSDGRFEVTSSSAEYMSVYTNTCNSLYYKGRGYENIGISGLSAGDEVYIRWDTDNGGDFSWDLSIGADVTGDNCYLADVAVEGTNAVPETISPEYWYSATMPSEGRLIISSSSDGSVSVYSGTCGSLSYEGGGWENAVITSLNSGDEVLINWQVRGGDFSWDLSIEPLVMGDNCSLADVAVEGTNAVPITTSGEYWYSYTMPGEGRLEINSETYNHVAVKTGTCDDLTHLVNGQNISISDLNAGDEIYFKWSLWDGDNFNWNLSVEPFIQGDLCSDPFTAVAGSNNVSYAPNWFSYTAPAEGDYIISSFGTATNDTYLKVYSDCSGTLIDSNDDHSGTGQSQLILTLSAGDEIFILWDNTFSSAGFEWTLTPPDDGKAEQTISFGAIADKTYGDASFSLNATASSGLPVAYSVVSGPATVSGNEVTITGTGSVTISADQAGDEDYEAAPSVEQTFDVDKAILTVTADDQSISYGDAVPTLTYSYSGFVNSETVAVVDAGPDISTTATGSSDAGTYPISLSGGTDDNYSFTLVDATLTIEKINQTITVDAIADKDITDVPFDVTASTTSGLTLTYTITSGPATTSGNTITLDGDEGMVYVNVSQAGNTNYNASSASIDFRVIDNSKTPQTITFDALADKTYGDVPITLGATASSGLEVSYNVSGPGTLTGEELTITGAGLVTIEASQSGDATYQMALPVEQSFSVNKAPLTVTAEDKTIAYSDAVPTLTYTYSGFVNSETVAVINNEPDISTVATGSSDAGTYAISLSGGSDDNYTFDFVDGTLTIEKIGQVVTIEPIGDKFTTDAPFSVVGSSTSDLTLSYSIESGPATIDGDLITLTGEIGTVVVKADQPGNVNYTAASANTSFEVTDSGKENQAITISTIEDMLNTAAPFEVEATTTSGLELSYAISSGPATISESTITLTGETGTVIVEVSQAGNETYNSALASETFDVLADPCEDFTVSVSNQTDNTCAGAVGGTIEIAVSEGTTPYAYSWSNGADTKEVSGLAAGVYTVIVTDDTGCVKSLDITITEPDEIEISSNVTDVGNDKSGAIDITVTGGSGNYTFSWDNGETTEDLENLDPGTYTITVTDESGCSVSETVTVTVSEVITGFKDGFDESISLYPNPARAFIQLEVELDQPADLLMELVNMQGQKLETRTWTSVKTIDERLVTDHLLSGQYLLLFYRDGEALSTRKVFIK